MLGHRSSGRLAVVSGVAGVAGAVLVAGVALTGCGSVQAGTAAEVGDQTITVSYLQEQVEQLVKLSGRSELSPSEIADTQRALLHQLVEDELIVVVAADQGVTATGAEISKVKAEIKNQQVAIPPDMLDDFARWITLRRELNTKLLGKEPEGEDEQAEAQELVGDEIVKVAKRVGVQVNPRYGTWDGSTVAAGGALVKVTPPPAAPQDEPPPAG